MEEIAETMMHSIQEYEDKIKIMEEEKEKRGKETISNLQTLIKELTYIEERNDELSK